MVDAGLLGAALGGWWRRHWERTGIVSIDVADTMPDGWQRWLDWHQAVAPDNAAEIQALEADRGEYLGYVRVVGRRQAQATLADHVVSVPSPQYTAGTLAAGRGRLRFGDRDCVGASQDRSCRLTYF